jgi:hypothetical protein
MVGSMSCAGIRLTLNQVEIFLNGERLALHPRDRSRSGKRIKIDSHFPAASLAYYEATPQQLLSQSRFIHAEFHQLVVELFNADVYGNIRRVQGLIRSAGKEIHRAGREAAVPRIVGAIAEMRRASATSSAAQATHCCATRRRRSRPIPFHPPRSPCYEYRNRP